MFLWIERDKDKEITLIICSNMISNITQENTLKPLDTWSIMIHTNT